MVAVLELGGVIESELELGVGTGDAKGEISSVDSEVTRVWGWGWG